MFTGSFEYGDYQIDVVYDPDECEHRITKLVRA